VAAPGSDARWGNTSMAVACCDPNWGDCATMKDRGSFGGWIGNLLVPYTKNIRIFACPSNPRITAVNVGNGCAGQGLTADGAEAYAREHWGIQFLFTSYAYNYRSLWGQGLAQISKPADTIAIWDSFNAWVDCP